MNAGAIVDYKVITTSGPASLALQVNAMISSGWEPLGGIAVEEEAPKRVRRYHQAMVRRSEV